MTIITPRDDSGRDRRGLRLRAADGVAWRDFVESGAVGCQEKDFRLLSLAPASERLSAWEESKPISNFIRIKYV